MNMKTFIYTYIYDFELIYNVSYIFNNIIIILKIDLKRVNYKYFSYILIKSCIIPTIGILPIVLANDKSSLSHKAPITQFGKTIFSNILI